MCLFNLSISCSALTFPRSEMHFYVFINRRNIMNTPGFFSATLSEANEPILICTRAELAHTRICFFFFLFTLLSGRSDTLLLTWNSRGVKTPPRAARVLHFRAQISLEGALILCESSAEWTCFFDRVLIGNSKWNSWLFSSYALMGMNEMPIVSNWNLEVEGIFCSFWVNFGLCVCNVKLQSFGGIYVMFEHHITSWCHGAKNSLLHSEFSILSGMFKC